VVKSLLILMLAALQVLSGTGAARFLCISRSGSVCIDSGPESCQCCGHDESCRDEEPDNDEHGCCHNDAVTKSCDAQKADRPAASESAIVADETCGCTHISISAGQYTVVKAASTAMELDQFGALLAWASSIGLSQDAAFIPTNLSRFGDPPYAARSQALSILATIVIRC
jgi:hypothetical protein